ncbi:pyruvate dehydrogenase (acetyl-transferring), homodimeric type [bacterium]|nr:pyruvate dehydrogenase (acetyl-transferring), homodimeric type [bacterium]NBW56275.1 pyruvate dehydrogenase (acetyl-transferring), homodimeric type [bacterium]NBX72377.1 pyruvate dehydrogenase (acetyl-transferring), homodimeric type [bacterium]
MADIEFNEWLDALKDVIDHQGQAHAARLIKRLAQSINQSPLANTYLDYTNTISLDEQPLYPGDQHLEDQLENLIRWNALAMVVRAQSDTADLGGHIGTFASVSTLYDVGFNHFWKAGENADLIFFQGHSSPGIYARSFLEYRLEEDQLKNFRREVKGNGLSSYPHPWLMPNYWQFPTVSMGLGPLQAIYQARFMRYLHARGLIDMRDRKVWCFCGDGEMDEPESLGALSIAAREKLNHLIFVVNCNLQRLDGPVRGNGKIISELEKIFLGNGWMVLKVIWNSAWDQLLDEDVSGVVRSRMQEVVDGDMQAYSKFGWEYFRDHFFTGCPEIEQLKASLSEETLKALGRGAHDRVKIYAAYAQAVASQEKPVVILAHSIKGYGLGSAGQALNTAHNTKKLDHASLLEFKEQFQLPLTLEHIKKLDFYRAPHDHVLTQYIKNQRQQLGGFLPERTVKPQSLKIDDPHYATLFDRGSAGKKISTTMAFVRLLGALLRDRSLKKHIVPIVPDEARTFGMEGLFKQLGIYHPEGQCYDSVDKDDLMPYVKSAQGQLLQEGINEAGAFSSWLAAATSYTHHDCPMVPFYIFYSMFGFQRIGDLCWAAGDSRARGFMIGATAGRTTLHGEGLQHQDGHSHVLASTIPNGRCYDPAFSFELAHIIDYGLTRIIQEHDEFFYITTMNENYEHPAMPNDAVAGIIKGMYLLKKSSKKTICDLLGSGAILNEVLVAADILEKEYQVFAHVWSVTSFTELRADGLAYDHASLHQSHDIARSTYIEQCLGASHLPVIAATDYMKIHADQIRAWIKRPYVVLGTDGYGRSDTRSSLRDHFEVSSAYIVYATLKELIKNNLYQGDLTLIQKKLNINPDKKNPLTA